MIDQERLNVVITEGIRGATGCEVVKSNLTNAPIPGYPYVSFTILNTDTKRGTYGVAGDGRYIPLTQTWSFTVQSDKDNMAQIKTLQARDWLEETGRSYLNDNGIVVQSIGAIAGRDTLLTVEYEYRKGFDVVFSLMNRIVGEESETIDQAEIVEE